MTAAVFHTMHALLLNIQSQTLLLNDISPEDHDPPTTERAGTERARLVAINDAAGQKSRVLRVVLRKMALNCSVIVATAVFGMLYKVIVAAQGVRAHSYLFNAWLCFETAPVQFGCFVSLWCRCCRRYRRHHVDWMQMRAMHVRHVSHVKCHTSHLTFHS
jgi:hypothetical protein